MGHGVHLRQVTAAAARERESHRPRIPTGPKATLRQKLEAHIQDANCAACHAKIDPLGLAFENYDAIGRWRTEEVTDGIGENPKVTAAGKLPDGREYLNV